jgi:hypothetical protein
MKRVFDPFNILARMCKYKNRGFKINMGEDAKLRLYKIVDTENINYN